ncbi:MAG: Na+/H+ antiporter subunit E [Candidatus Thiodiazotropha taylori]|nr:Na+/H+ antiporter subunit E [Candidatus Thiodiazotropha endolucinida]MCG8040733.1 Na+/H+ antiporter subunit E [Candidatus Thiodiazotropha taylori]MCG8056861.1 Na+/H+ antiporter subunit E [Candidatus Thiodiazotropha taylori]MCW4229994.1 Na+/H+ antiporter subunit E [Candidatus Thiodiazotropha taylori]MCW4318694.1 Na+/H+ antiporter subunit E [Candidatus Thiodiazotropha taylori]
MTTKSIQQPEPGFVHGLFLYLLVFTLWMLLVGNLDTAEMAAGVVVALVVTLASRPHLSILAGLIISPSALLPLLRYLGTFIVALVQANLDMARRVLSPSLPLQPAVVEVETNLKSPLGRLILANSITLTPGTLTVDVQDEVLLVHWVDAPPGSDRLSTTKAITSKFEQHLKGFVL